MSLTKPGVGSTECNCQAKVIVFMQCVIHRWEFTAVDIGEAKGVKERNNYRASFLSVGGYLAQGIGGDLCLRRSLNISFLGPVGTDLNLVVPLANVMNKLPDVTVII